MKKQEDTRQTELAAKAAEFKAMQAQSETAFELMKKQEDTRQTELAAKAAEFKAMQAQSETAENEHHRARNQELVKMQEESSVRQEQARRATEEQIQAQRRQTEREKAEIERETIRVRAMAEAEGRAHEAKLAEDVNKRMLIERGLRAILTDQNKLVVAVGGVTALAAGIYTTRNMLFYGPPGTGKTMAARELAKKSGLDYALMTGGDVAPLGSQAVTKIHQLFDWAKKSNRGLRNKTYMSEAQRSALNALLFRTGDQSKDIVLALATNRPGDLDSAVADRIDEVLEFPLPGEEERYKLLKLYLDKYIAKAGARKTGIFSKFFQKEQQQIEIKGLNDDLIREAAAKTEGFSGREVAKLMASVQAAVYGSENCVLDTGLFREVIDYKVAEHQQRRKLAGELSAFVSYGGQPIRSNWDEMFYHLHSFA
uniref:ATPase family AAA domain-containing protein 3-like n=1 Tax=Tanacetum cinerariifolium TaxID=118510 RepID=A0A6L2JUX9_TANCI|nr:ATPase family AAA domain-containing protein 3-like [Tanacetum cinerariifolium]